MVSTTLLGVDRRADLRRAIRLSVASVIFSGAVGAGAVVVAAASGSLSLLGFGVDAAVDAAASVALIWRFTIESRQPERAEHLERTAERVVGLALTVFATYLALAALRSLAAGDGPEHSFPAAVILMTSVVLLPPLALAKRRVARRLGSGALGADSILTGFAAILAMLSLGSLAAAAWLGLWWADATAALIVAAIVVREGIASIGGRAAG